LTQQTIDESIEISSFYRLADEFKDSPMLSLTPEVVSMLSEA
jgi:hypothetical protein